MPADPRQGSEAVQLGIEEKIRVIERQSPSSSSANICTTNRHASGSSTGHRTLFCPKSSEGSVAESLTEHRTDVGEIL
jgi:hypothetical protein